MYAMNQTAAMKAAPPTTPYPLGSSVASEGRMPELPATAERLFNTISRLYDIADQLDCRLTGTVARSAGPAEAGNAAKAVMNTGFGAQLDQMNDQAVVIENRLMGLLQRLEF